MTCYFCNETIEGDFSQGYLDLVDIYFHNGCWDILGNGKALSTAIDLEGKSIDLALEN